MDTSYKTCELKEDILQKEVDRLRIELRKLKDEIPTKTFTSLKEDDIIFFKKKNNQSDELFTRIIQRIYEEGILKLGVCRDSLCHETLLIKDIEIIAVNPNSIS